MSVSLSLENPRNVPCVTASGEMRRPLYLFAKERVQVRANRDFLVVQPAGHGARHFAFAKIDRVVCHAGVDWSGEALARCLMHRVTISWLTGHGELLGYCAPRISDHEPLHLCMARFASLPSASTRWDNWFRHRRMVVLSAWAENRGKTGELVSERDFRRLSRGYVYQREPVVHLSTELLGSFQSFVIARLTREGAQCTYPARGDTTLDLLAQMTLLLWGQANLDAGTLAGSIHERRIQWQFLEAWHKSRFATLEEHMITLKLFLAETLSTCP